MNICKKLFALVFLLGIFNTQAHAQIIFGAHANTAIPLLGWGHGYNMAKGAGAKFGYNISDVFSINASADYFLFGGEETRFMQKSKFPIHANGEARIKIGRFTPYGGLGAGMTLQRDITIGFRKKFTSFSASAVGGVNLKISDRVSLGLNTRFFWDNDSPMQSISIGAVVGL